MKYRTEFDSLGKIKVPGDKYWGASTQRSNKYFDIGDFLVRPILIQSIGVIKKAAAIVNTKNKDLNKKISKYIIKAADEVIKGKLDDHFPLKVWQTGSGTQTNMNVNEVISNRCQQLIGKDLKDEKYVKANDDVNKSQSSNDTFPTAMHIAAYKLISTKTLPALEDLKKSLHYKSEEFKDVVKIGRTHMMDATPITLGQEFSAFKKQIENGIISLESSMKFILEIALGGTAVGTGLNTPDGYSEKIAKIIANETGYPFVTAENKFEALSSNDSLVDCHNSLKKIAVSINKISNDIRMLSSGPRSGIGEIILPANEPGSSIMPGKVNPTQCEAMSMVCSQVIGNDSAITFSGTQGHFQLNVFKPVIIYNFINSSILIADAVNSFNSNCIIGIIPNLKSIKKKLDNSLMLVTALNPKIGYYKAAEIANNAYKNDTTLRDEAIKSGYLTAEEYDQLVDPRNMT